MIDSLAARKEFNQIITTLCVQIPETLDEMVNKLNGLGGLLTAGEWARAAFVRAWVEKSKPGPKIGLGNRPISMREFAALGIQGLSTEMPSATTGRPGKGRGGLRKMVRIHHF
jgi:hypothetical protein